MSFLDIKIGFFLAIRQIRRANKWTTGLIVFVMILTFLNLVVVSGILVGLIEGSIAAYHAQYTGDVVISSLNNKKYIEGSPNIINILKSMPDVKDFTPRFSAGAIAEANYQTKKDTDKANTASAQLIGINPAAEDAVTGLSNHMLEGSYLTPNDYDKVLVGYFLLKQYITIDSPDFSALENVYVGTKIRLNISGVIREVTVKGILKSKVDNVRRGIFMIDSEAKELIGRSDNNVSEIAINLKKGVDPIAFKQKLLLAGVDKSAKVQTYADAQPQFLKDIVNTFATLGNFLSSIGLVVSSITIFIVIFINALTRRKFIGILKGIGINGRAIELSYIFQSIFYALSGSLVGLLLVYFVLVPLFIAHPIDFPFSDGILVAPLGETLIRMLLLIGSTIIAGYVPSRMIVRKNTLDSILGRN
jgi:ABC-type lipoprotein release transport system permease subunit